MTRATHLYRAQFLTALILCLVAGTSSLAQVRPVTGIMAHYDSITNSSDDYSTPGSGGAYPTSTTYDMKFNVGDQNNLMIQGFETGTNVYDFVQLAQWINIVRVDNPTVTGMHNIVFFEEETISGTNQHMKPSLVSTMTVSLRSDLVNRGADNVFRNTGNGADNNASNSGAAIVFERIVRCRNHDPEGGVARPG